MNHTSISAFISSFAEMPRSDSKQAEHGKTLVALRTTSRKHR